MSQDINKSIFKNYDKFIYFLILSITMGILFGFFIASISKINLSIF